MARLHRVAVSREAGRLSVGAYNDTLQLLGIRIRLAIELAQVASASNFNVCFVNASTSIASLMRAHERNDVWPS